MSLSFDVKTFDSVKGDGTFVLSSEIFDEGCWSDEDPLSDILALLNTFASDWVWSLPNVDKRADEAEAASSFTGGSDLIENVVAGCDVADFSMLFFSIARNAASLLDNMPAPLSDAL